MKFEGSFSSHLLGGGGEGGVRIKNGISQESVRSHVNECTAINYATLSSCKSYLGE